MASHCPDSEVAALPTTRAGLPALPRAISAVAVVGGALVVRVADPSTTSWYPPCLVRHLTGFECPGCGSLRAAHSLVSGDMLAAFDYNLLLVALAPVMVWWFVRWLVGARPLTLRSRHIPVLLLAFVTVLFTLARNSGSTAFAWLAAGA